jgi:hypothetical protein
VLQRIDVNRLLPDNHPILEAGERLFRNAPKAHEWDAAKLGGIDIVRANTSSDETEIVRKPNGDLLFMLIKNVIEEHVWLPAYDHPPRTQVINHWGESFREGSHPVAEPLANTVHGCLPS